MAFDTSLLLPAFTDIFQRRPQNVSNNSLNTQVVDAGHNRQYSIKGEYLEGNILLNSSSERISFQNISQSGEKEITSISAIMNASSGADENNIKVWGYVNGQNGNQTAKFEINNALAINEIDAQIYDFSLGTYNWVYPEMTRVIVNADEDTGTVFFTADGKTTRTHLREFVYTVENQNIQNISVQAINNYSQAGNTIIKPYNPPRRPFVHQVVLEPAWWRYGAGYAAVPFQISYIGDFISVASGKRVPHYNVICSTTYQGWGQPAYLRLTFNYSNGDIPYPVNHFEYGWQIRDYGFNQAVRQSQGFNALDVDIIAPYQNGWIPGMFDILARPVSSIGTQGELSGIVLIIHRVNNVVMTTNPTYVQATYPRVGVSSEYFSLQPDLLNITGKAVSLNTAAQIVSFNP